MPNQIFKHLLLSIILNLFCSFKSLAQVFPDNTLGAESSKINSINGLRDRIEGGAIRGDNLFHSFIEFGVQEGLSVNFANPEGIANIFSRVTGGNISEIFGTLGVDGAANLFLMNPNGIVFGENAAINVSGSFLATTAETIDFNDGNKFSSVEPNEPLLTIDFPMGLGFGSSPGTIRVNDTGHNLVDFTPSSPFVPFTGRNPLSGLRVQADQTLALLGGSINMNGGILSAEGGNIELGSVTDGFVRLIDNSSGWTFNYEKASFGNINLISKSLVDASGFNSGSININGANVRLADGTVVLIQNLGSSPDGNLRFNASKLLEIKGISADLLSNTSINTETISDGRGADIFVSAPQILVEEGSIFSTTYSSASGGNLNFFTQNLIVDDGGGIGTTTNGMGMGGDLNLEAIRSIEIKGISPTRIPLVFSTIATNTRGIRDGGNINISTRHLIIEDRGVLGTNVLGGFGKGGDIFVNASDSIRLTGTADSALQSSIVSTTFGLGNAGTLKLATPKLFIHNGGAITASTFVSGNAGELLIDVSESIEIKRGIISSSAEKPIKQLQQLLNLPSNISGFSGKIAITTPKLSLSNGASVTVRNDGTGDAGNLEINADSLSLDNASSISASTLSGEGGNIVLNTDNLELLNQSQITASAGGSGDGGNITIDSDTILGIQNSDITANAVGGDGGNITITADAIIGFEERSRLTPFNDITATSEFGLNGTVTVNSPESNAEEDIIVSAKEIDFDPYRELFKGSCFDPNRKGRQELVYVGAGQPESPYSFFDDEEPQALIDSYPSSSNNAVPQSNDIPPLWQEGDPLIEPNAVQTNPDGRKFLVAVEQREISEPNICTRNAQDSELD